MKNLTARGDSLIANDVKLIEYSKAVDRWNCITHAVGAVFSVFATVFLLAQADNTRKFVSGLIYGLSMLAVYTVSSVYHGLPMGETKRRARLVDHSAIPILIAGTSTPCALITLHEVSVAHGIAVFVIAWFCAVFGVVSKVFFFEKLKAVTMAVYIISCVAMLGCAVPLLGEIDVGAFLGLLAGCIVYVVGAVFCYLGIKRPALHIVFHIFVFAATVTHYAVIYNNIYG